MAFRFLSNRIGDVAALHITSDSEIVIAGNSSVSNVAIASYPHMEGNFEEIVEGATIRRLYSLSPANTAWTVKRGANVVAVVPGGADFDLKEGLAIHLDATANLVANVAGGTGVLVVELSKTSGAIKIEE